MSILALGLTDWLALGGGLLGLGGLVALGEWLSANGLRAADARRLVHAGVGLFVVATPVIFTGPGPVAVIACLFVVVNATAQRAGWWPGVQGARPGSRGTVLFPLAVLPALACTWFLDPTRIGLFQSAFLTLALADPLASWVGERRPGGTWVGAASVKGSLAFFGGTSVLVAGGLVGLVDWSPERALATSLLVAAVATPVEGIAGGGWDNIGIVMAVLLVLIPLQERPEHLIVMWGAVGVGVGFAGLAFLTDTLDEAGAVGGGLFAASLVGLGGWAWALPGFVFFALSSLLSRLTRKRQPLSVASERDDQGRSLRQVLANGGIAWGVLGVAAVVPPGRFRAVCYAGFLGALAAAAADTWASEAGEAMSPRAWSLRTGAWVPAGTSGAVSLTGTGAGALGAATIAGAALFGDGPMDVLATRAVGGLIAAGLIGMAMDSVAGAFLQARYRHPEVDDALVERAPAPDEQPVRGWSGVNNEAVNVMGTAAGALAGLILL